MMHAVLRSASRLWRLCPFVGLLFCGALAYALPDNLTVTATNPWTRLQTTFNLTRYNLRATNYQVRIYSDATTYTLLPTNQIPEVTTYRGRISGDPGAVVVGTFKANGDFYYNVSYGCRWQSGTNAYDPYDTTNRLSWGGSPSTYVATTNIPTLGYVTNYPVAPTNVPQRITWSTNNYPAPAPVSYGGPPYLNNLKQVPLQRVRLVLDSDYVRLFCQKAATNVTTAILMQESRVNDVDYEQARDLGVCYQIQCVCVRTNTQLPYTTTTGDLSEEGAFWSPDPGYSHGVATNGWFDMVHGSVNVADAGGWAGVPGDFSVMDPDWWGFASGHEMGHNWGQGHYTSVRDYTGDNFWHVAMDGSGFGYATIDVNTAQSLRRTSWKGGIEWVKYNYQVPPHATPDLATTRTNQAVSLNVLLNDYIANSNTLTIVSHETNTLNGGTVANLGNGLLQYIPKPGFAGYDLFHYYVGEPSGLKSLTAAKVLVTSDATPLLGQWALSDTNGTSASEVTGNGQAGTLYGTANFSSGSVPGVGGGRALHFDGAGYIRFQGTWFDAYNTNLSLSLWVRADATPSGEQMLFMKSSLAANNSPGFRLGMNPTSFFFSGCTVGGQSSFSVTAAIVPQAGVWYHLVGEIDRTSGLVRLWVNGVEFTGTSNTRSIPAGEFIAGDNWPVLGMANDGSGNKSWFTGALDDLRLYSKALSAAEVAALYQGSGLLPAGGPHPSEGEINVALQPAMTWQPGNTNTFQYNLYLGTNAANVAAATTNSAEFQGRVSAASFSPAAPLGASATYFWRVDEVYGTNVVPGSVWSFATAVDSIHGGLKLYLSLDNRDTVGTNTFDRAGAPYHDGALYNLPALTAGAVYEGMAFNGTSSYVETPPLNLNSTNLTLLAWINSAGAQSSYAGLLFCRGGATVAGLDFRGTTGQLGYHWNNQAATYNFISNLSPPTNQWALVALTVQNNRAIFYLGRTNGILQTATNNYTHVMQAFEGPLSIARDSTGGRNFNGAMDEVCVWNRVLSPAEISQILSNGINGAGFGGPRPVPNAATFTWTGNSDIYWTNSLNWATNDIPGAANTVYFNDCANGNTGTQLGANLSVAAVNISGGLRGVGISGTNTLTIGTGGVLLTNTAAKLTLGAPVSLGTAQTWTVPDGSTLTLTSKLSGSGNPRLTKEGDGALYLNNNASGSSYSGLVVVNAGTLVLPDGWGNPSLTGNVSVGTNGTLVFNSHPYSYSVDNYTTNAGTLIVNADSHCANLELRGGQVLGNGYLRVGDYWGGSGGGRYASRASSTTATINIAALSLFTVNSTFTVENGSAEPDLLIATPLKDGPNGAANFTKTGAGSLTLTKPSLYTGNTTNNQGTLSLSDADNILPVTTGLHLAAGTTLNLSGINQTVARLTGSGTVNLGSGSLTITTSATNAFGGVITGAANGATADDYQTAPPGGLAMAGPGKWTLSSVQAYSGDTWVSSGTLALSGTGAIAGSSNVVVSSGAVLDVSARADGSLNLGAGQTLQGFGTVLGKVTVATGATLAPGQAVPGTLTTGAETWYGGGSYAWRMSDPINISGGDLLNISNTLNVQANSGNQFVLKVLSLTPGFAPGPVTGFNNLSNYQWTVATAAGGIQNFNPAAFTIDTTGFSNSLAGGSFSLSQSGNALVLAFAPPIRSKTPGCITNSTMAGGAFALSGIGGAGEDYVLQATTNLAPPSIWERLLTNQADGSGLFQLLDTQATNFPLRFYRVTSP